MKNQDHHDATRLGREVDKLEAAGYLGFQQHLQGVAVSFDAYHLVPGSNAIERLRVSITRALVNDRGEAEYKIVARRTILRWWIIGSEDILGIRTPLGNELADWLYMESYFPNRAKAAERRRELELALEAYAGGKP